MLNVGFTMWGHSALSMVVDLVRTEVLKMVGTDVRLTGYLTDSFLDETKIGDYLS